MPDDNGWNEWSRFVLKELERLSAAYEAAYEQAVDGQREVRKELSKIHTEIATLQLKAGIWGLLGAAIPVVIMMALNS